jgi:hypothetical protein
MNFIKRWRYLPVALVTITGLFIAASLLDIVVATLYSRFYTTAAFVVLFGVAGIFAAFISYTYAIAKAPVKNEFSRWSLIITIIITGLLFFFLLAPLDGGEYDAAFRSFGVTLALSSIFFMKGKIEW